MKAFRPERISKEIQRVLAEVFEFDINDPRLQTIVILNVETTKDLKKTKIYYTTIKDEEQIEEAIERAKGYIRRKIAEKMEIKYIPEISFIRR